MTLGVLDPIPQRHHSRLPALVGVGAAVLAGLAVRGIAVLTADFPLNDGGLFHAMTAAILEAGGALPSTVSWNGDAVPFLYPPLGFYVTAGIVWATGQELVEVQRWLPLVFNVLTIVAVFGLARSWLGSVAGATAAAMLYALAPVAYAWPINGGGITRAPALLLAVAGLWAVDRALVRPQLGRGAVAGAILGATALTHPATAAFAVLGLAAAVVHRGWSGARARMLLVAAAAASLVVAPWLGLVIGRHGIAALTEVAANGPEPAYVAGQILMARFTGLPFADPLAVVILAVALRELLRGRWLLPAWWLVALLLGRQYGIVPASLLVGLLAADLAQLAGGRLGWAPRPRGVATVATAALSVLFLVEAVASAQARDDPDAHLTALSEDRRAAMSWIDSNLPPEAQVAVLTGSPWATDADSEWFFVIANRASVVTVQGSEWQGRGAYGAVQEAHAALQACAEQDAACIEDWLDRHGPASHLFIPKGPLLAASSPIDCCAPVRADIANADGFRVIYDGVGATIIEVVDNG